MSRPIEYYITSPTARYQVLAILGRGTFARVYKCLKQNSSQVVAVKVQINTSKNKGEHEGRLLARLNQEDTDEYNLIKCFEWFHYKHYICIEFEMLQQSLRQFINKNGHVPLHFSAIRPIVLQILTGLGKLKELGIMHADLKPENIMLVDMVNRPYRIKIIDFGNARYVKDALLNARVQTRYYRAPEVLLGLPICEAIDMWSLGCIAAELSMGHLLYPGASGYDQIRCIVFTQGLPGENMLANASKRNEYFSYGDDGSWQLKDVEQYAAESGVAPKVQNKPLLRTLDDLSPVDDCCVDLSEEFEVEKEDRTEFIHLVKCMLELDPHYRATPMKALSHSFLKLGRLQYPTEQKNDGQL